MTQDRSSTLAASADAFAITDTAAISRIEINDRRGHSAVLTRKGGEWTINNSLTVAQDRIRLLLETLSEVEVKNPVPLAARDNVLRDLASSGTIVKVYKGEKLQKKIYIGGPTPDQEGTTMLLEGMDEPMITHLPGFVGYLSPRFYTEINDWRSRKLFDLNAYDLRSVAITYPDSQQYSFVLNVKGGDDFEMTHPDGTGTVQVKPIPAKSYLNVFRKLYLMDFPVLMSGSQDSVLQEGPLAVIRLQTTSGPLPEVNIYIKSAEQRTKMIGDNNRDLDQFYGYYYFRSSQGYFSATVEQSRAYAAQVQRVGRITTAWL